MPNCLMMRNFGMSRTTPGTAIVATIAMVTAPRPRNFRPGQRVARQRVEEDPTGRHEDRDDDGVAEPQREVLLEERLVGRRREGLRDRVERVGGRVGVGLEARADLDDEGEEVEQGEDDEGAVAEGLEDGPARRVRAPQRDRAARWTTSTWSWRASRPGVALVTQSQGAAERAATLLACAVAVAQDEGLHGREDDDDREEDERHRRAGAPLPVVDRLVVGEEGRGERRLARDCPCS